MSNVLGTINPIKEICALAKAHNALTLVDGCQAAMHMTVDVQALGCDFYAFSAHKLYGPTGAGVLWGKYTHLETMSPYQGGGEMIASVSFEKTTFAEAPIKFEAGTPPIVQVIGMGEAIKYIQSIGIDNIQSYESQLLEYATTQLTSTFPELSFYGQAKDRSSILSFTFSDVHAHDVCTILNSKGVAARAGHHCAQPVMTHYQIAATTRASIGLYNTESDIDALVIGLKTVQEVFQS